MTGAIGKIREWLTGGGEALPAGRLVIGAPHGPLFSALERSAADAPLTAIPAVIHPAEKDAQGAAKGVAHAMLWGRVAPDGALDGGVVFASHPPRVGRNGAMVDPFKTLEPSAVTFAPGMAPDALAAFFSGAAYYDVGRYTDAVRALEPLAEPEAAFWRGLAQLMTGQAEEAFAAFNPVMDHTETLAQRGALPALAFGNAALALRLIGARGDDDDAREQLAQARDMLSSFTGAIGDDPWYQAAARYHAAGILVETGGAAEESARAALLREAVEEYEKALALVSLRSHAAAGAVIHRNLAATRRELAARVESASEAMSLLKLSVRSLKKSAAAVTREQWPADWAAAHDSLGDTYGEMARHAAAPREKLQYLAAAVGACRAALSARDPNGYSPDWAATLNNLAAAVTALAALVGGPHGAALAEEALRHYDQALTVFTETHFARYHQGVSANRAHAMILAARLKGEASSAGDIGEE